MGLLFTYALTYGGAVISLFNPFYGLLIYICFAILWPPALWPWSVPIGNYSRIIGIAFLTGWALNGFGDHRLGKAKPIVVAMLGYFLWVILSTIFSLQPDLGTPFIEYFAKIVLPFVAGVTLIRTWGQLKLLMWVILGCCAFLAYEANLAYLHGYSIQENGFLNLDNNTFSILMTTGFGLALVLGFEDPVLWRRFMCFGMAAAMAHVPMLAWSRGGMVGTLAAAGVAVAVVPKSARTFSMIAAAVVVASVLAGPSVIARFSTTFSGEGERDSSAESRIQLWHDCVDVTLQYPVFGVGKNCWKLIVASYGWTPGKEAHSLWFETAAELGIPGVAFLILFYYRAMIHPWRASRVLGFPEFSTLARIVMVSLTGFAVSASFVTVEGFELPYYVALLGACGLKIAWSAAESEEFAAHESLDAHDANWRTAQVGVASLLETGSTA